MDEKVHLILLNTGIWHIGDNRQLFTEYKNQFRHSEIPYPAMFIGNKGITGSSDIIHTADQLVKGYVDQYLMRDQLFPVFS